MACSPGCSRSMSCAQGCSLRQKSALAARRSDANRSDHADLNGALPGFVPPWIARPTPIHRRSTLVTGKSGIIAWLAAAEEHNSPAAESCLFLIHGEKRAARMVAKLGVADIVSLKLRGVFCASRCSLVSVGNPHLERDRKKVRRGADARYGTNPTARSSPGYHALFAQYAFDEAAWIDCRIIQTPGSRAA